jgi:hypothetical protein
LAIAGEKAAYDLGFINKAAYHIGQAQSHYSTSFFDVATGNNTFVMPGDTVRGFNAGPGWDAATGLGSPITDQLINYLIRFVSPADGTSAVAESGPHPGWQPERTRRQEAALAGCSGVGVGLEPRAPS